ncbi:MAG: tRNA uridine-5-carboxymethylaminomethyl(34) synthesis GTPase MnmE [Alphaproteobacteria bacterium]|nr:tRNA uridine-5-carboxymethylaminomethyl(34) synthesis GTPase MnmE [Alphaproteobacteria bacterium]
MGLSDTIYALSSGVGQSAVAIVRVSGDRSRLVVVDLCGGVVPPPRVLTLKTIIDPRCGDVIDRGAVVWMPGPASFTGEDVAEFHVHGSVAVVEALTQAIGAHSGVRPAEPGEFTRRAFLNGKMDLAEVEGLGDLLAARTRGQRQLALHQMLGKASSVVEGWRGKVVRLVALVDAVLEFPDEGVAGESVLTAVENDVRALREELVVALVGFGRASAMRDGVRVVLAGLPNVGKSSLLNAVARREAAIVSDVAGTTRDVIEVQVDLSGIPVVLSDTAGLTESPGDEIEVIGVSRTWRVLGESDVVIWVGSVDVEGSLRVPGEVGVDLHVVNKCDQGMERLGGGVGVDLERGWSVVSCHTGEGVEELVQKLGDLVRGRFAGCESAVIVRDRQKDAVENSIRFLNDALEKCSSHLELVGADLRRAADELGRITGRIDVEDWLDEIFSRFCIGK